MSCRCGGVLPFPAARSARPMQCAHHRKTSATLTSTSSGLGRPLRRTSLAGAPEQLAHVQGLNLEERPLPFQQSSSCGRPNPRQNALTMEDGGAARGPRHARGDKSLHEFPACIEGWEQLSVLVEQLHALLGTEFVDHVHELGFEFRDLELRYLELRGLEARVELRGVRPAGGGEGGREPRHMPDRQIPAPGPSPPLACNTGSVETPGRKPENTISCAAHASTRACARRPPRYHMVHVIPTNSSTMSRSRRRQHEDAETVTLYAGAAYTLQMCSASLCAVHEQSCATGHVVSCR